MELLNELAGGNVNALISYRLRAIPRTYSIQLRQKSLEIRAKKLSKPLETNLKLPLLIQKSYPEKLGSVWVRAVRYGII